MTMSVLWALSVSLSNLESRNLHCNTIRAYTGTTSSFDIKRIRTYRR